MPNYEAMHRNSLISTLPNTSLTAKSGSIQRMISRFYGGCFLKALNRATFTKSKAEITFMLQKMALHRGHETCADQADQGLRVSDDYPPVPAIAAASVVMKVPSLTGEPRLPSDLKASKPAH